MVPGCVCVAVSASATPARADIEGAYERADIPPVEGSSIICFDRTEFCRFTIPTGLQEGDTIKSSETPQQRRMRGPTVENALVTAVEMAKETDHEPLSAEVRDDAASGPGAISTCVSMAFDLQFTAKPWPGDAQHAPTALPGASAIPSEPRSFPT